MNSNKGTNSRRLCRSSPTSTAFPFLLLSQRRHSRDGEALTRPHFEDQSGNPLNTLYSAKGSRLAHSDMSVVALT